MLAYSGQTRVFECIPLKFWRQSLKVEVGNLYRYMSRVVLIVNQINHEWFDCLEMGETTIRRVRGSVLEVIDEVR